MAKWKVLSLLDFAMRYGTVPSRDEQIEIDTCSFRLHFDDEGLAFSDYRRNRRLLDWGLGCFGRPDTCWGAKGAWGEPVPRPQTPVTPPCSTEPRAFVTCAAPKLDHTVAHTLHQDCEDGAALFQAFGNKQPPPCHAIPCMPYHAMPRS